MQLACQNVLSFYNKTNIFRIIWYNYGIKDKICIFM